MLERYPPKSPEAPVPTAAPVRPDRPAPAATDRATSAPTGAGPGPSVDLNPPPTMASGLISLDRPFDVDEFSQSLGETQMRVLVPRENLAEVLRRVMDFMGFGIYVYSVRIAPEDSDTLRRFVVELQRVDYSTQRRAWVPFEEKGRVDSPFGPSAGGGSSP